MRRACHLHDTQYHNTLVVAFPVARRRTLGSSQPENPKAAATRVAYSVVHQLSDAGMKALSWWLSADTQGEPIEPSRHAPLPYSAASLL